jgi:hypothetical protein
MNLQAGHDLSLVMHALAERIKDEVKVRAA